MSLLTRTIVINSLVITGAFMVLVISPVALVFPLEGGEAVAVAILLLALLGSSSWAIIRSLTPLRTLHQEIARVEGVDSERRMDVTGAPELEAVAASFNNLLDRLADEQRERTRVTLSAQEAERLRIARELHDEIGQTLTFSLMSLANVAADHPEWEAELAQPRESLRAALEQTRAIASALRPGVLEDLGLRAALADLTHRVERESGLRIERTVEVSAALTDDQELVIFRVCQEALTNVLRHARASAIHVRLAETGGRMVLEVADDGMGYAGGRGAGVEGMAERASLVAGTLNIDARPGGGSSVRLSLPLLQEVR